MVNMSNERLNALLKSKSVCDGLSSMQKLNEVKKIQVAMAFVEKYNIESENLKLSFNLLCDTLDNISEEADYSTVERVVLVTQGEILTLAYNVVNAEASEGSSLKKQKADAISVASHVLPDFLNNMYVYMDKYGMSKEIKGEDGEVVFDYDEFFAAIGKLAVHEKGVNNLTTFSKETTKRYRKVIEGKTESLLVVVPYLTRVDLSSKRAEIFSKNDKNSYDVKVRKFRYYSRPSNKEHELLPSYLDYVTLENTIVPFEEFKATPSYAQVPFESEKEYLNFVNSDVFKKYVSYLETANITLEEFDANKHFELAVNPSKNEDYELVDDRLSDYSALTTVGYFPKEVVYLDKYDYKNAKDSATCSTIINKQKNQQAIDRAKRIGAGTLAALIIAMAISVVPISLMINESTEAEQPSIEETETPSEEPEDSLNVEDVTPEELPKNPSEDSEEVADNVGENGTIVPDASPDNTTEEVKDEETTPEVEEEVETPEEFPVQPPVIEEENDPSFDQPDKDVPEKNDEIHDKREEENSDDEFFFD